MLQVTYELFLPYNPSDSKEGLTISHLQAQTTSKPRYRHGRSDYLTPSGSNKQTSV